MSSTIERDPYHESAGGSGNDSDSDGGGGSGGSGGPNSLHQELYNLINYDDDWTDFIKWVTASPMILDFILRNPLLKKKPLVQVLLEYEDYDDLIIDIVIPNLEPEDLEARNLSGDTALHIAAAMGNMPVVTALLNKNRELIEMRNSDGEVPLHKAALGGHTELFWHLYTFKPALHKTRRFDGTTASHCAVMANNFELAMEMLGSYNSDDSKTPNHFLMARDQYGLTVLHHLVSMPHAFRSGCQLNLLDALLYSCIPQGKKEDALPSNAARDEEDVYHDFSHVDHHVGLASRGINSGRNIKWESNIQGDKGGGNSNGFLDILARWIRKQVYNFIILKYREDLIHTKKKHETAMELLSSIAGCAEYWRFLNTGGIPKESHYLSEHSKGDIVMERWMETPLTLAARHGLDQLVMKILEIRPVAATYRGKEGKNLLQVAVECRSESIVKRLVSIGNKEDRRLRHLLLTSRDYNDNTILHLAAIPNSQSQSSPMQMLEEFKWFDLVKNILPKDLVNHRNKDGKTAQELFTESHVMMVDDSKKQLMATALACSSALVSAVTFAAGFSIINGNDKEKSAGDRQTKVALNIFSHTYMFGLSCTAVALLQFMSLIMASYKEEDFRTSLPTQFMLAFASLFTAMFAMVVAFGCNTYIGIHNNLHNSKWKNFLLITLEVFIFPLICLLVMCYRGVKFPFFSVVRRFFQ